MTVRYTDKKENKIFLIFKEIQNGAVAKSYEEILNLYEEAFSLNFLLYDENSIFFFYQCSGSLIAIKSN